MWVRLTAFVIAMLLGVDGGSLAQRADGPALVMPDRDAFFASVRANLIRAERVTHQFSYKERRTRFHTNPFGRLGTGGEELFHVFPSIEPRLTYRRLLARDGHMLSAAELARQDRVYRARSATVRRRLENETAADAVGGSTKRGRRAGVARRWWKMSSRRSTSPSAGAATSTDSLASP